MARAFLRAGARLALDGQPHRVERQCRDGTWVLRHLGTERSIEMKTEDIYSAYVASELRFEQPLLHKIADASRRRTQQLPVNANSAVMAVATTRLHYVRIAAHVPQSEASLRRVVDEVWEGLPEPRQRKPSWVTVYRWCRALAASNAPETLIGATSDRGNRRARFPSEVERICEEVLESVYLTPERPTLEHALNIAKARIRDENRMRPTASQLPSPSRKLFQRMVHQIPEHDRYRSRHGNDAARRKYRTSLQHRLTNAPLERGEMDHTRMNVFVIDDESGVPLGRPWLTTLIDDYTRTVLGYCISFEPPSRATVAKCLRHAFMPKVRLDERFPDLQNDWKPHGVVSELVLDGGVEFHSEELQDICFELNIEQHFSPRKTPWFKGKVERFLGTLNRGVTVSVPGKTFDSIVEREDYDPSQHAVLTLSSLEHVVVKWIVDVYHQKAHRALGCSPEQMWQLHAHPHEIGLMADPLRFDAILGGSANRVLSHKGIEFAGLVYNSPAMGELRRVYGERQDVQIRIDRSNLGSIIVLHPESGTPYRVPCLRQDYAEGLTEWQHDVCKRYARRSGKGSDVDDWIDALLAISELVHSRLHLGRGTRSGGDRVARWRQASARAAANKAAETPDATKVLPANHPRHPARRDAPSGNPSNRGSLAALPVSRKHFEPIIEDRGMPASVEPSGSCDE